jgi:hypothetical protein
VGLELRIVLAEDLVVDATVRWSRYGRTGVEFARAIGFDAAGQILPPARCRPKRASGRKRAALSRAAQADESGGVTGWRRAANGCANAPFSGLSKAPR